MTNDIRVLARKRFEAGKDLHTPVQTANRHDRRAAQRHAKLLEATRMRVVGQRDCAADFSRKDRKDTLRAELEAQGVHSAGTRAGMFVALAVALELSAAACGSAVLDEPDADVTQEDAAAEVEQDVPDVPDVAEDERTEAEDVVEDAPPEAEEDVGPEEADVPDSPETVEDAGDIEDIVPEVEEDVPEAGDAVEVEEADATETVDTAEDAGEYLDTYDCTATTYTERGPSLTGPEFLCGSTQTTTTFDEVTLLVGPDCEGTTPTRRMIIREVTLSPYLDTSGLGCARTRTVRALNGDEVIVTLTDTRLETASGIICADMSVGTNLDGGIGEYKFRMDNVRSDQATGIIFDPDWVLLRSVRVYGTGVATINASRGLIANDFNDSAGTARLCMIVRPTIVRDNGGTEVWTSGDWGTFTWNTAVVGTQLQGWEWVRP